MAEMHICDRCGKPTPNYEAYLLGPICGVYGYSLCDDCSARVQRFIEERPREKAAKDV